jgi:1,4-dihydroxy-2-naphthoate octaprenyltransferase
MRLKFFLRAIKPFRLLSVIITYSLGAGIIAYFNHSFDWSLLISGIIFLLLFMIGIEILRLLPGLTDLIAGKPKLSIGETRKLRWIIAITSAVFYTVAATFFVGWMLDGILWIGILVLIFVLLFAGTGYYFSKLQSGLTCTQLFFEIILFVIVPPAFAFLLHVKEVHKFLTMAVLGLVPSFFAYRVLIQLQHYGSDQHRDIQSFVVKIGWKNAMVFHNASLLLSFVLFSLSLIFGFPWLLIWPVYLILPLALVEVWLMERVRAGAKPLWVIMKFATGSVFVLQVYLLAFNFWIR